MLKTNWLIWLSQKSGSKPWRSKRLVKCLAGIHQFILGHSLSVFDFILGWNPLSFLPIHCWLAIHSWLEFIIGSCSAADGELQWGKPDCECGGEGPVRQPLIYDGHHTQQHRRHRWEHLWHTFSGRQLASLELANLKLPNLAGWSVYQYLLWVVLWSKSPIETSLLVGSLLYCPSTSTCVKAFLLQLYSGAKMLLRHLSS